MGILPMSLCGARIPLLFKRPFHGSKKPFTHRLEADTTFFQAKIPFTTRGGSKPVRRSSNPLRS